MEEKRRLFLEMLYKATAIAKQSTDYKQKIGCVITDKRGRVIATGVNKSKTHPVQKHYAKKTGNSKKIHLHAEISALIRIKGKPHSIYISRIMRNGATGLAKPCPLCQMAIEEAGIENVVYTK